MAENAKDKRLAELEAQVAAQAKLIHDYIDGKLDADEKIAGLEAERDQLAASLETARERAVKPLCVDLFCGLGGWSEGFLAEGYDCIGFDIERHDYGTGGYPGQLVLQDVLTLHGAQFKDAAVIVASPPCQKYSYMSMPWTRAKKMAAHYRANPELIKTELNALFRACFRIQREASEAAGRHIPLVVENVRGARPWVGEASWSFGSFYLWGDVPALMPNPEKGFKGFKGFKKEWRECEASRRFSSHSKERKAWSAQIAKIPFPLARHIAQAYKPRNVEAVA